MLMQETIKHPEAHGSKTTTNRADRVTCVGFAIVRTRHENVHAIMLFHGTPLETEVRDKLLLMTDLKDIEAIKPSRAARLLGPLAG